MNEDAAVAGAAHDVVLDRQPARIERVDRDVRRLGDGGARQCALDAFEADAAAARARHLAIHDAKIVALREIDERAVFRQGPAAAVEHQARQREMIGGARRDQCGAAGEDQPRRAAHADQLRAARQLEAADAIIAGTEHQRHARARGLVDRGLQHVALVGAAAGAHAELRGIDAEGGKRRRTGRSGQGCDRRGASQGGDGEKTTAIDFHDPAPMQTRSRQFKSRARKSVPRWHRSCRSSQQCDSVNAAPVSEWEGERASARRERIEIDPMGRRFARGCGARRCDSDTFGGATGTSVVGETFCAGPSGIRRQSDAWFATPPGSGGARRHRS